MLDSIVQRLKNHNAAVERASYGVLDGARQEFRVLFLGKGRGKDTVKCTLAVVSLMADPPPRYETISYHWGDAKKRAYIEVDGIKTDVPASSKAALLRMRLPDRERILWIDAICINQADIDERSQQVSMMRELYRNSAGNLIYLGEDDGAVEEAVNLINAAVIDAKLSTSDYKFLAATHGYGERTAPMDLMDGTYPDNMDLSSLQKFFGQSWFHRLWVVQESALAPTNTCFCGRYSLRLLDILRAAYWIREKTDYTNRRFFDAITPAANLFMLVDREHGRFAPFKAVPGLADQPGPMYPSLSYLLKFFARANFNVTEPKDGLFALLGLIAPPEEMPAHVRDLIRPDYKKALWDIHRDATRYCLYEDGDLSYLRNIMHLTDDVIEEDAPSWIVRATRDWDTGKRSPLDLSLGSSTSVRFQSCGDMRLCKEEVAIPFMSDPNILSLRGIILDVIGATSDVFEPDLFYSWKRADLANMLRSVAILAFAMQLSVTEEYQCTDLTSPEELSLSLVRILVADAFMNNKQINNDQLLVMQEFLSYIMESGPNMTDKEASQVYEHMTPAIQTLMRACRNRRFFVTELGLMGLGPRATQSDDLLAVFHGGTEPYVVRCYDDGKDRCRLVGQAYGSHGVMFGAAIETHAKSGLQNVMFHLV